MYFKAHKSFGLVMTLAASLVLVGCQGGIGLGGSTADSRLNSQTEKYEAKFFGKSGLLACAQGGLVGALTGAISGQAIGKDSKSTAVGAAIGAAAGCAAGMGANYYLEQQRTASANKEVQLNSSIKDVKSLNVAISQDIKNARSVIQDDMKKLTALNSQIKNKSVVAAEAKQQLAKVDANIKRMKATRDSMQKQYEEFLSVAKQKKSEGTKTANLDSEISKIKKQITEYDSMITSINQQRNAIKVG